MADAKHRTHTVYALSSSEDFVTRYIGQTSRPLEIRLRDHFAESRALKTRRANWINATLSAGHFVVIRPLVVGAVWNDTETRLIALYQRNGFDLVNATSGGQGVPFLPKETREKIAKAVRGHTLTDDVRRRLSIINSARMSDPSERELISRQTRKAMRRPDVAKKMSDHMTSRWESDSYRKKRSEAVAARFALPSERAAQAERRSKLTPEQVMEARRLRSIGMPLKELCLRFGIAKGPMSMLCRGLTHKHLPMAA